MLPSHHNQAQHSCPGQTRVNFFLLFFGVVTTAVTIRVDDRHAPDREIGGSGYPPEKRTVGRHGASVTVIVPVTVTVTASDDHDHR